MSGQPDFTPQLGGGAGSTQFMTPPDDGANGAATVVNGDGANGDGANGDGASAKTVVGDNVPPKCKYDGYVIKYDCGEEDKITFATITKSGKELGRIKVGHDDKLNINYQNSDDFAKIIFKENASAVQSDIKRIYNENVSKMKNIDSAIAEFYKKYGVFVSPPSEKSIYYIKPFGKFTSATPSAINTTVLIGLSNILIATEMDPTEKDNILQEIQEKKKGGKTRNRKRRRSRTMRKRQTL